VDEGSARPSINAPHAASDTVRATPTPGGRHPSRLRSVLVLRLPDNRGAPAGLPLKPRSMPEPRAEVHGPPPFA